MYYSRYDPFCQLISRKENFIKESKEGGPVYYSRYDFVGVGLYIEYMNRPVSRKENLIKESRYRE